MVDFESIPNTEKVDLLKTITKQANEYFKNPVNKKKYQIQIKEELNKRSA